MTNGILVSQKLGLHRLICLYMNRNKWLTNYNANNFCLLTAHVNQTKLNQQLSTSQIKMTGKLIFCEWNLCSLMTPEAWLVSSRCHILWTVLHRWDVIWKANHFRLRYNGTWTTSFNKKGSNHTSLTWWSEH